MQRIFLFVLIEVFGLSAGLAGAQTPKIQKQVDKNLEKARAEQKAESVNVGEIIIVGFPKDDAAIRKALKIYPGQALDDKALQQARSRMGPFNAIIEVLDTANPRFRDILVKEKQKADDKSDATSLEKMIAEALKNNLDIRVADAKVREAEAELNRTRMKVVSDVTFLKAEIQAAQAMVDYAKKQYDRVNELRKAGAIEERVFGESTLALEKAKADLAAKQAKLPYLLGKQSAAIDANIGFFAPANALIVRAPKKLVQEAVSDEESLWIDLGFPYPLDHVLAFTTKRLSTRPDSPLTEKLRKALDAGVVFQPGKVAPKDALEAVHAKMFPGINLHIRGKSLRKEPIDVKLTEQVPVGAVLQYLEDELDIVFVLREYGIVVVPVGEPLPPGATRVIDFWKQGKTPEAKVEKKATSK